jgi:hypothetical protein
MLQRAFCVTENSCTKLKIAFCIIVLVIIEYGVGIGSRRNVNIKCDIKNESESML